VNYADNILYVTFYKNGIGKFSFQSLIPQASVPAIHLSSEDDNKTQTFAAEFYTNTFKYTHTPEKIILFHVPDVTKQYHTLTRA
jgi:hypothetical protein